MDPAVPPDDPSLRSLLTQLGAWPDTPGAGAAHPEVPRERADYADTLATRALARLGELEAQHGVQLLGDHDPGVASGFFVARGATPSTAQLTRLLRSWEAFDRAFEACEAHEEAALFDGRLRPFLGALGAPSVWAAIASEHAFVVDGRYVASLPDERLAAHLARVGGDAGEQPQGAARDPESAQRDSDAALRGLRRVLTQR